VLNNALRFVVFGAAVCAGGRRHLRAAERNAADTEPVVIKERAVGRRVGSLAPSVPLSSSGL
jgi:hypothetical protein